ncbi:hypothetical protein DW094_08290 [Ruminococcaceae bacterium AM07-15]|nr:hypothetical protein DW094_08290 [Ruminococcaceae bacterium AM07-15]
MIIPSDKIYNINHVKDILDNMKFVLQHQGDYEDIQSDLLETVGLQLAEIDEFIIGSQLLTEENIYYADMRMMQYWNYINGKSNFNDMIEGLQTNEGAV